ncbi:DUF7507 domain-containing protein, partial [Nonlabens agnitus]|uniref:DUF7507 domain-containing protein n=1 Tax=Nonlabens agnitus TaxID=870484 RepID=UPI001559F337
MDTTTFSGSYTIQQSDIDAGTVSNQALATGTNPDGDDVTDTSDDPNNRRMRIRTVTAIQMIQRIRPSDDSDISLLKRGTFNDENGDGFAQLGRRSATLHCNEHRSDYVDGYHDHGSTTSG